VIKSFNIHTKTLEERRFLTENKPLKIALTSGASCPDSTVDRVMMKLLTLLNEPISIEEALGQME